MTVSLEKRGHLATETGMQRAKTKGKQRENVIYKQRKA